VTDRWWLRPLVAAVLGVLPFVVFAGTSQTTVVNGLTVHDSALNLLGLGLAVVGIAVAVATLRRRPGRATVIAAGLAGLVCLGGVANSLDLLPRAPAVDRGPDRPPPPLPPAGLDDRRRELERQYFAEGTEPQLRSELMRMASLAIIGAVEHERYATACWPDDVRLTEAEAWAAVPTLLTPAERAGLEDSVRGAADQTPPCSAEADEEFMVYRAGIARNDRDRLVLQAELFRARFGG
jgi:hypothetical protein